MSEQTGLRGRYFEEFELGEKMTSPGRTVTEADIVMFAGLSGDYNQLHTNAEYAEGTMFGERIAHGLLGLAIASGLGSRLSFIEGTALAFLGLDWKFKKPIRIGDTVHLTAEVTKKKEMSRLGGGVVVFNMTLLNQRGEITQKGQWKVLVKSRTEE